MHFVYHMVPFNMQGEILVPLNELKEEFPKVFSEHMEKYKGRLELIDENVPKLNCKWNDVLHFSPIEPKTVFKALIESGHEPNKKAKFFKVPLNKLSKVHTVIFHYSREDGELTEEEVDFLDFDKYRPLTKLCEETLSWYRECKESNKKPLLFHRVPHILSKVRIDISDCEVIGWCN